MKYTYILLFFAAILSLHAQDETINGNLTVSGTTSTLSLIENGHIAYPTKRFVIDLKSQPSSNFIPVLIEGDPAGLKHFFNIEMQPQNGTSSFNMHSITAIVRGQGWTDQSREYEIYNNLYDESEKSILGIYRGTKSFNQIVVYLRGGSKYYVSTTSKSVTPYTTGYTSSGGTISTFAIKDSSGNDLVGTSLNIGLLWDGMNAPNRSKSIYGKILVSEGGSTFSGGVNINGTLKLNEDLALSSSRVQFFDQNGTEFELGSGITSNGFFSLRNLNTDMNLFSVSGTGNMILEGELATTKVRVSATPGSVPDYVFSNNYQLKTLQEVEKFIDQNSHLPNIPSAEEIEANGQNIGELQLKLLEKIEELTLYTIEQQKFIQNMQKQLEKQQVQIAELLNKKN